MELANWASESRRRPANNGEIPISSQLRLWSSDLSPYIAGSFLAHSLLALAFILIAGRYSSQTPHFYTIDFVGPSAVKIQGAQAPSQNSSVKSATASANQNKAVSLSPKTRHFILPKPSLLSSASESIAPTKPRVKSNVVSVKQNGAAGPAASANISADLPNFPYPWYISELRAALWDQWSKNLPSFSGKCEVVFEIMPDGRIVDLKTESSSGESDFDLTALSSVQDASPFPPLPQDFHQPFLKIHLTLTSN